MSTVYERLLQLLRPGYNSSPGGKGSNSDLPAPDPDLMPSLNKAQESAIVDAVNELSHHIHAEVHHPDSRRAETGSD